MRDLSHLNEGGGCLHNVFELRKQLYHPLLMDAWKALRYKGYKSLNVHAGRPSKLNEK